jgi:hypothetical protein
MAVRMKADRVPRRGDSARQVGVPLRLFPVHEEGGHRAHARERGERHGCPVGVRTVVEGEIDRAAIAPEQDNRLKERMKNSPEDRMH